MTVLVTEGSDFFVGGVFCASFSESGGQCKVRNH